MSPVGGIAQTRMMLLRSTHRLERVHRAASLLRKKREALVTAFFLHARPVADARAVIDEQSQTAYRALAPALAVHGSTGLRVAAWPLRDVRVDIAPGFVGGIPTSDIAGIPPLRRTLGARGTDPALTGPAAAMAASEFEQLALLLVESAPRELVLRWLAAELARTSRQVNVLERRTAPALEAQIAFIRRSLEEREREERLRLRVLRRSRFRHRDARISS